MVMPAAEAGLRQPRGRYCARRADSVPAQTDHRQGRDASHRSSDRRSRRLTTPRYRGKAKVDLQNQFIGVAYIIENGKITKPCPKTGMSNVEIRPQFHPSAENQRPIAIILDIAGPFSQP